MPAFGRTSVRVRAPATSANLGPAFDSAGLCLALWDEVEVELRPGGLEVTVEGEGARTLPRSERHLVLSSLRAAFDRAGGQPAGLAVRCRNAVPQSRGLGSSAAAIVAGVLAAHALLADQPDADATLSLAAELEGHPDNVAACLRGGFTLAWQDAAGVHVARRDTHPGLLPVLLVPPTTASTQAVRQLLPAVVPHADAAAGAGRAALLALAVTTEPGLLLAATEDRLHQRYRAPAMPQTDELVRALRADGVPAVVSGAGPSVLALTTAAQAGPVAARAPYGWQSLVLPVDLRGACVLSQR